MKRRSPVRVRHGVVLRRRSGAAATPPAGERRLGARVVEGVRLKFAWRRPRGFESRPRHAFERQADALQLRLDGRQPFDYVLLRGRCGAPSVGILLVPQGRRFLLGRRVHCAAAPGASVPFKFGAALGGALGPRTPRRCRRGSGAVLRGCSASTRRRAPKACGCRRPPAGRGRARGT